MPSDAQVHLPDSYVEINGTDQFQTGALTSRPAFKQRIRSVAARARAAEQVHAVSLLGGGGVAPRGAMLRARDALGVCTHHDAVTGTMSTAGSYTKWAASDTTCASGDAPSVCAPCADASCMVLEDYQARLDGASADADSVLAATLTDAVGTVEPLHADQDGTRRTVVVYNPLASYR